MAERKFSVEMTRQIQYQIMDEIEQYRGKRPLADAETLAQWPGAGNSYSVMDAQREARLQTSRVGLGARPPAVWSAGMALIGKLDSQMEAVHYAALELLVYQNLLSGSEDPKKTAFLTFLIRNAQQYIPLEVQELDDALEGLAYLALEKQGPLPAALRERIFSTFGVDLSPELCALPNLSAGERKEYIMLFESRRTVGELTGKFGLWDELVYDYDRNFNALFGGEPTQGMERIQIDGVSLTECMKGKLENLSDEEEVKLRKLILCAAVLSKNAKVVCHVPDGAGGTQPLPIRAGNESQIEPESLNRFLEQFQFCYTMEKTGEAISANDVLLRPEEPTLQRKGPERSR